MLQQNQNQSYCSVKIKKKLIEFVKKNFILRTVELSKIRNSQYSTNEFPEFRGLL